MARKQKMKVYHGVPKSIVDEHTIFYADFDGTGIPTVGNIDKPGNISDYKSSPTGYCPTSGGNIICTTIKATDIFTIDMFVPKFPKVTNGNKGIITLKNSAGEDLIHIQVPSQKDYLALVTVSNGGWQKLTNSQEDCFVRLVVNKGKITTYINGKKFDDYPKIDMPNFNKIRIELHPSLWQGMCDLHISDIDRGNYFPNLPQDFIEGKATIKPKMGQQQIKGDPMYSQPIALRIPSEKYIGQFYNPIQESDGLYRSLVNPELAVGSNSWSAGSKLKIKGLNGEIIGGVVDTNTAVCRVTKNTTINGTSATIEVDNTSKIQVNDTLRLFDAISLNPGGAIYTVTSKTDNSFSANLNMSVSNIPIEANRHYFFEITSPSSCPTIKTQDGIAVAGTWNGLGTKEATFTLGDNANISGKDLYVEYSLTMSHGNSDFTDIPYEVKKAWEENGIEMIPVSNITIIDDFKGKISGKTDECPHIAYNVWETTLQAPGGKGTEFTQSDLNYITTHDANSNTTLTTTNGNIPQQRFSFNLIEMIERKFGCQIPGADKVRWLKDNIARISFNAYAFGVSANKNKLYCKVRFVDTSAWSEGATNESASIGVITNNTTNANTLKRIIDSAGFVHFLLSTNASDGSATAAIHTDYAYVELELRTDSDFTTLYCKNNRAREDKCNPVLVQKETKTIKRYLPSKECFATECTYAEFANEGVVADLDVLINKYFSIGMSTSSYSKYMKGSKINLNQLPLEKAAHLYAPLKERHFVDLVNSNLMQHNITEIPMVYWRSDNGANLFTIQTTASNFKTCISDSNAFRGQRGGYKDSNNNVIIYGDIDKSNIIPKDGLRLYSIALVVKNNEVMLYIIKSSYGSRFYIYSDAITLIKLPNRPLIK